MKYKELYELGRGISSIKDQIKNNERKITMTLGGTIYGKEKAIVSYSKSPHC